IGLINESAVSALRHSFQSVAFKSTNQSMASCARCFRRMYRDQFAYQPVTLAPPVQLDNATMGQGVVLVKNGRRICGTGAARANCPVSQDKAYWEVKLQSCGSWGIGLGTVRCDLESPNNLGSDAESWALRDDAAIYHGNQPVAKLPDPVQEGDVIGLTYDHVTLEVFLNGKPMHTPVTGIRGTVFPTFYVDDGAILDCAFAAFAFGPPVGFRELIKEKQLL
ncbi:hypothetical protein BOX15_Mlig007028g3, partial [Macrostomum lignano]